jgi:predicted RNA-binding protein with EMAP domain
VWNYSKKDIENIQKSLRDYKEELILKENQKTIEEKIKDLKHYIDANELLEKNRLIEVINNIEEINNDNLNSNEKWSKLKECLDTIKNQEREIGTKLLEIIVLITK